jgi:hypothetical protein
MNLRIVSMPVQKTAACSTQSTAYVHQPSKGRPRKPYWLTSAYGMRSGKSLSTTMSSAAEAR